METVKSGPNSGQGTYSDRSLHGRVVHTLGQRIVSGTLGEGAILPNEADLGADLSVSRTALREAVKVLTAKGLVESRTRTGTRVRPRGAWNMLDPDVLAWRLSLGPDEKFLRDLYEFRRALEPAAAALAAEHATPEALNAIEKAFKDMVAAGDDIEAGISPDLRFHKGILLASGNEMMAPLGALIETALGFSFRLSRAASRSETIGLHGTVLEAIRSRDPEAARDSMAYLLSRSVGFVRSAMDKGTNPKMTSKSPEYIKSG